MGLVAALILFGGYLGMTSIAGMKKDPPRRAVPKQIKTVKAVETSPSDISTRIEITGRLAAKEKIEIFTEVGGLLKPESRRFREGNAFRKGQALMQIDNTEARLNLLAQRSSLLNQIILILPDLKLDYPEGYPNWQAYVDNFDPEKTTPELPKAATEKEKYFISAKNLLNLYYSIRSQEVRLAKYTIRAPFSGVVSESNIQEGTLVRVGQKMGEFFNPNVYELEAAVNLKDLDFIKPGNQVNLTSTDVDGIWTGTVRRISNTLDENTQTVKVYIEVSGKNLKEGMYLDAEIKGNTIEQAIEIPRKLMVNDSSIFVIQDTVLALHRVKPIKFTTSSVILKGVPANTMILNENIIGGYEGLRVNVYGLETPSTKPETRNQETDIENPNVETR
jgi:multidrug efflux pump subunit AcrA (membrane-fusion protein)